MRFLNSMTRTPGEIAKVHDLWKLSGDARNPFAHLLSTPVESTAGRLRALRSLADATGAEVTFDSGGFYVQVGRLTYDELYGKLLGCYTSNQWADWYVLPDWVPVATDSYDAVWRKIKSTVTACELFARDLPPGVSERAIGVIHGRTREQIEYCLDAYLRLGISRVGFGSFSTKGPSGSVNTLDASATATLADVVRLSGAYGLGVHAFGIGSPASIAVFDSIGVSSFDSVSWMKTAGYGNIHLPFSGAYNVSCRDYGARSLTRAQFEDLQRSTGHSCPFCESFDSLRLSRDSRMMHNLVVMMDTLDRLREGRSWMVSLRELSPRYARLVDPGGTNGQG